MPDICYSNCGTEVLIIPPVFEAAPLFILILPAIIAMLLRVMFRL